MKLREKLRRRRAAEAKLKTQRELLLRSVRGHILAEFVRQGFGVTEAAPEFSDIFPLGHLRRIRADGAVDLVEIQFMTHRRAAFRINACAVPQAGIMTVVGWRAAEELPEAGGLQDHFELYSSPRFWRWFALPFWWFRAPVPAAYERLALRVVHLLPEVELALREGKLGPHMRRIAFPVSTATRQPVHRWFRTSGSR